MSIYSEKIKKSLVVNRYSLQVLSFDGSRNNGVGGLEKKALMMQTDRIKYLQSLKILSEKQSSDFIPCLFLKYQRGSSKLFLYFHANAEDLGRAHKFLSFVNIYLRMHVLAVEYPGYGVYTSASPSASKIMADAEVVYRFVKETLRWKESDVVVCGRSIGSGPACFIASEYSPSAMVLVSPHTSIWGIVKDQMFGRLTQYAI